MERIPYTTGYEIRLKQCQETIERFRGSEETLRYIRRVEESLKSLIAKTK